MHSLRNSISKRLYTWRLSTARCAKIWGDRYWQEIDDVHAISCACCPKLHVGKAKCSIPFGSPVRKCVTAAQEAHLHSLDGKNLLEIGFGKHSIPRHLAKDAGGTWTGIETMLPMSEKAQLGKGGYGHVADIPFPDNTFDVVTGIQSIEHWDEPLPDANLEIGYAAGLREVYRVLKPNGFAYFCAPMHLHGHEMFIAGDIGRIRELFEALPWHRVTIEKWREEYRPLDRYQTPDKDKSYWKESVSSYSEELLDDIYKNRSVGLITITAYKR